MGHRVRVGDALLSVAGNIGRCVVTTRDPESGEVTLPTLKLLANYRGEVETTEPLPFGIYATVIEPGRSVRRRCRNGPLGLARHEHDHRY